MRKYDLIPREIVEAFSDRLREADRSEKDKSAERQRNKFRELLEAINTRKVGDCIERKDFDTKTSTFDGYKRSLQIYQYLQLVEPGVYKILRKVPEVSLGELRKIHLYETRGKTLSKITGII
jgi:hypothetical protein